QRGDRMHLASAPNRRGRRLRQSEKTHLAFFHELRHRANRIFNRRIWVDAMLIVKIDRVDAEALEAGLARGAHIVGAPADFAEGRIRRLADDAELGRDYEFVAPPANRAADQLFIAMRPVGVRGVPEGDSQFECALERVHRLRIVARAVEIRHAHASEANRRHEESALSKLPRFHFFTPARAPLSTATSAKNAISGRWRWRAIARASRESRIARTRSSAADVLRARKFLPRRCSTMRRTWSRCRPASPRTSSRRTTASHAPESGRILPRVARRSPIPGSPRTVERPAPSPRPAVCLESCWRARLRLRV